MKGFTLIELLVVVLIIGILAAIALPQYQKAVEKSRLAEVLQNTKTIEQQIELSLLSSGFPSQNETRKYKDFASVDLNGGNWDEQDLTYTTKKFEYYGHCSSNRCWWENSRAENGRYLYTVRIAKESSSEEWEHSCWTQNTDLGRYICNSLKAQGWTYTDSEL